MKRFLLLIIFLFSAPVGAYNEGDLEKLKATGDCQNCDLSKADLRGADLKGANLTGANLRKAYLPDADLTRANLEGADLTGARLWRSNLTGANLSGANLTDTNFDRVNLSGADLRGVDLSGAGLYAADLAGANLSGANLTCADLAHANMTGANLQGTITRGANLFNSIDGPVEDLPDKFTLIPKEYRYREDYSFTQEPFVSPLLLLEMFHSSTMEDWDREDWNGENIEATVNLPEVNNTDQKGCFSLDSDGWVVGIPWDWQNHGEGGAFGYQQLDRTESGIYVLLAKTWVETVWYLDILLVRLERDSFLKVEVGDDPKLPRLTKYPRFLLKLVGTIHGVAEAVHQFKGEVSVKGDKLHIVKRRRNVEGSDNQEVIIDLETMEYKKDKKRMLLDTLLSTKKCPGCDLTWANLTDANLSGANLTGADLRGANLRNATLIGANLTEANLREADLFAARLIRADLSGASLSEAFLYRANLSAADLTGTDLFSAELGRANLTDANLSGANLTGANLEGTIFCNTTMPDGTINSSGCQRINLVSSPNSLLWLPLPTGIR